MEYRKRNKDKIALRRKGKKNVIKDIEKHNAKRREWYEMNKELINARAREWRKKNKSLVDLNGRIGNLRRRWGLTIEQYDAMLDAQGGVCAICGTHNQNKRRFAVDHDHSIGTIRGLLCVLCNTSLGMYEKYEEKIKLYLAKNGTRTQ